MHTPRRPPASSRASSTRRTARWRSSSGYLRCTAIGPHPLSGNQEPPLNPGQFRPSYNIAPTDTIPVLIQAVKGDDDTVVRRLEPARWSLVPGWSKALKVKYPTFNARSEDLASKTTWKGPLKTHRALVPASRYFEWQTFSHGKKVPHFIHNPAGEPLMFAGLYSWWKDHTVSDDDPNEWTLTTTILTAGAVDEFLHIHDRNQVMLPEEWWDQWLDPTVAGTQELVDAAVAAALPVASSLPAGGALLSLTTGARSVEHTYHSSDVAAVSTRPS
ncbi:SOS response-associated peptidase [Lacisediminihabitans sp. H27-G8]|uniref:SOS response-associated peptidase n=1 Tax=Lacisediminihabitans sp. H27-G8 TaxID=3111909 RepID=UPI0038FC4BDE